MTVSEIGSRPVVGIDIGGTKTHLRAVLPVGQREITVVSSSWRTRDWMRDAALLLAMVADLTGHIEPVAIGIGAHGCDDDSECEAYHAAFAAQTRVPVAIRNDAELMPLAVGLDGQIGLVAGTGSVAVARSEKAEMLIAGGWGWIIGDDGSAAGLMREAIRAVALHLDCGGTRDEPLVRRVFETLEVPRPARISSALGRFSSATEAGRHANVIFAAAEQGSALADGVIRSGGRSLADLVRRLERRGALVSRAVAGGSVIANQPRLWRAFCEELDLVCGDRIQPVLFKGEPVEGAVRLAMLTAKKAGHVANPISAIPPDPEK